MQHAYDCGNYDYKNLHFHSLALCATLPFAESFGCTGLVEHVTGRRRRRTKLIKPGTTTTNNNNKLKSIPNTNVECCVVDLRPHCCLYDKNVVVQIIDMRSAAATSINLDDE